MLSIFDSVVFEGTKPAFGAWPHHRNPAVRDGKFVLVALQGDCRFRLRVTDGGLTDREKELVNDTAGPLGLEVASGRVYASGMDLPGEATSVYADHGAGGFIELPSGKYNVTIHELDLQGAADSERKNLPDFVAVISQRSGEFAGIDGELGFSGGLAIKKLLKELGAAE
jgi:hypothetical protein